MAAGWLRVAAWHGACMPAAGPAPPPPPRLCPPFQLRRVRAGPLYARRTQVDAVAGLSVVELALVIAARRLEQAGREAFNFEVRQWGRGASVGVTSV